MTRASTPCGCSPKKDCDCSRCNGLDCLERPRFFTGQLLTETELNSQMEYLLAKNRLHNLHLHGWGVVCGLEVVCHECPGWVTVRSGYAIDPCGNDVIVCEDDVFDVVEAIRRCRKERRKDCRPRRPNDRRGEVDALIARKKTERSHWCLKLVYDETLARPTTALSESPAAKSCGPDCRCGGGGGGGSSCGCGGGSGRRTAPRTCEPTRILESYRFELCEVTEAECKGLQTEGERAWAEKFTACFDNLKRAVGNIPLVEVATLGDDLLKQAGVQSRIGLQGEALSTQTIHSSYCVVLDFLRDLFRNSPGNLHCSLVDQLDALDCAPPRDGASVNEYRDTIRKPVRSLLGILVTYLLDCLCVAAQPPCAPCCPGDEELILACMTVENDEDIVDICNFACRRTAGAFPPSLFGIYLGPLMPIVNKLLAWVCCGDLLDTILGLIGSRELARQGADYVLEEDYANLKAAYTKIQEWQGTVTAAPPKAHEAEAVAEHVTLSQYLDARPDELIAEAETLGVTVQAKEVGAGIEALPLKHQLAAFGRARPGDQVIAYTRNGRVAGFAKATSSEAALVDQSEEIRHLKEELASLKALVENGGGPSKAGGKGSSKGRVKGQGS